MQEESILKYIILNIFLFFQNMNEIHVRKEYLLPNYMPDFINCGSLKMAGVLSITTGKSAKNAFILAAANCFQQEATTSLTLPCGPIPSLGLPEVARQ
jgi:hypothetical protein